MIKELAGVGSGSISVWHFFEAIWQLWGHKETSVDLEAIPCSAPTQHSFIWLLLGVKTTSIQMEILALNCLLVPSIHINPVSVWNPQDHSRKPNAPSSPLFFVTLITQHILHPVGRKYAGFTIQQKVSELGERKKGPSPSSALIQSQFTHLDIELLKFLKTKWQD